MSDDFDDEPLYQAIREHWRLVRKKAMADLDGAVLPSGQIVPMPEAVSLRDYFAGQALAGLVLKCEEAGDAAPHARAIAEDAYTMADAMLAERSNSDD